jgi:uncharacterized protein
MKKITKTAKTAKVAPKKSTPEQKTASPEDNQLAFSIIEIYKEDEGKRQEFHLEVEQAFDPREFTLTTPINVDVSFMKTETAITVILENFTCDLTVNCCRCLKKIKEPIRIKLTDRNFHFQRPTTVEDETDVFMADLKHMEIDLFDLFRQEILLHCNPFPVCSTSCKGVCPTCGKDLNKAKCGHGEIEKVDSLEHKEEVIHPFKNLKGIIKNDKS